jgi:hypothetical protein
MFTVTGALALTCVLAAASERVPDAGAVVCVV